MALFSQTTQSTNNKVYANTKILLFLVASNILYSIRMHITPYL